ncbi:hypothetical protein B0H63DRAFT_431150 [Podospora didyma]|uniref:JmjC domain-containing protein n=1 Tax=Podospora didyma TaxID=330526 RepID=A0AAE0NT69_9PEZI|nr:hypothetical protein B0H63DRAFT_431150 [Podospora didyma]
MPTTLHPQAKFDPIPPDLDLHDLVERTPNFQWVLRISAAQIRNIGPQEFEKLVFLHVIHGGKPLVIEKWNDRLPKSLFSGEWLESNYNKKQENVRDIVTQTDIPMTMGHYLRSMKQLTNQWTPTNFRDDRRQRLYLKDIDCPPEWYERLQKIIPPHLFYMNENVDERAGKRRSEDMDMFQQDGISAAPAGDLMSNLPEEMRAQNLMCYVGHEGTYTPAHREMCASLGQNIMIDASGDENGEKEGSSIWFMTETKDREVVREYFLSMLGHDIEIEKHFAQINAWKKATFPVYIVEQKVGDFILVPPLAPHQVWNRGTRTIKVAWNRTTVETLEMALHEALPKARLVCRDEQYKNKAIIYYTLEKYFNEMVDMERYADMSFLGFGQDLIKNSTRMKQIAADFKNLFKLFTEILVGEMFANKEKEIELIPFDSNITCSYCRANIFNRFFTCKHCVRQFVNGDEDTYDICMDCYAMGRSCLCVSNLSWCEQWKWSDLVDRYEEWRDLIVKNDGYFDMESSPMPLELERKKFGKKSVAQICQEQLKKRPWKDLTKAEQLVEEETEASEPEIDKNGRPVKKKKKQRRKKLGDVYRCHVCCHKDYTYKLAYCSTPGCTEAYCYGVLYRAFDMLPQEVMQNERWRCPKCLDICNCGSCRRAGHGNPYIPKNTLLGHDTRPIADDRSVESLVDFRVHNLSWLKGVGDESRSLSSKRMKKLQQAAEAEKAKDADLAEEVPALPDDELAESMDVLHRSLANEFGDQNEATGYNNMRQSLAGVDGQQLNGHQEPIAEVADMSVSQDQDQQSSYPDPSVLGHKRMVGMGYYQQDDSPDRILFDPYQVPSAESMVVDKEPEMSEYLKKQPRWAKRRARREEDNDPDFAGSKRSHQRKRPRLDNGAEYDGQQEALNNMDPALFGDQTMMDAPADEDAPTDPIPAPEVAETADQEQEGPAEEPRDPDDHRPYSPNRPALRHARPKTSYAEADLGEEEFDEIFIPRSQRPPEGINNYDPENANKDPLDLASAAILEMSGGAGAAATGETALVPAPSAKKRSGRVPTGRPPGRPRRSDALAQPPSRETETPQQPVKRRGRPPYSSRPSGANVEPAVEDTPTPGPSEDDVDAQLMRELDAFNDDGEPIERAIVTTTPGLGSDAVGPKRRGRSPRSAQAQAQAATTQVTVELSNKPFLSMADRMKLKGKKLKIADRRATGTPAATGTLAATRSPAANAGGAAEDIDTPSKVASSAGNAAVPSNAGSRKRAKSATESEDEDFNPTAPEEPGSDDDSPPPAAIHDDHQESTHMVDEGMAHDVDEEVTPTQSSTPENEEESSVPPEPSANEETDYSKEDEESVVRSPSPPPAQWTKFAEAEPSQTPPKTKPKPTGPTVVRLVDSESKGSRYDDESESEVPSPKDVSDSGDSTGSDSDDEDIPADLPNKHVSSTSNIGGMLRATAVRGGRGGRGRGRGRGRPTARRGM